MTHPVIAGAGRRPVEFANTVTRLILENSAGNRFRSNPSR